MIPGDGIGPEVSGAVVQHRRGSGRGDWRVASNGIAMLRAQRRSRQTGEYIPKALYDSIEENRVALKGPVTTPIGGGFASINVTLRQEVRAVCELPAGEEPAGTEDEVSRTST